MSYAHQAHSGSVTSEAQRQGSSSGDLDGPSLIPVILSGGSGTRLWPLSRKNFPKQFCTLDGKSLIAHTVERLKSLGEPRVLTLESMRTLTRREFEFCGVAPSSERDSWFEPVGRNTAPALAWVCKRLAKTPDAVVGVFPADHLISAQESFRSAVRLGTDLARQGYVVTLGIQPHFPATGFGYIQVSSQVLGQKGDLKAFESVAFHEKPELKRAQQYVQSGGFYWNAGMFIFSVGTMIEHFKKQMPELWNCFLNLREDESNLKSVYESIPQSLRTSIDYGVMEKIQPQACVPADLGWSDVGSWEEWSSLDPAMKQPDPKSVVQIDSQNNSVHTHRTVALVGVEDLIVVDTADALLISQRGKSQEVKKALEKLESQKSPAATEHVFDYRPWGRFEVLRDTPHFKSKVIVVNPGQRLSYQSHSKRAEHWIIIRGNPEVTLNDQVLSLKPGENVFIPQGAKHRISNPSTMEPVEFVEVQVGTYFGEDDIVRYQDDYKRT